ncbi:hypothetical protein VOLCADRAFT_60981 [Volvox carteri f. nagariensis]|uniref:beta-ketoacyl-[acyl-carrier-protein] synthase III n=1 Tax=Volvox carteri f. nagariensis TaxID=3068 RepID=D8TXF1_VOLCA|nr:uncharacterized protein VOLCADRAFT_60981 [Volvox carteri f. nagariensis]EFJ47899.1 hypothetical protein VOLCADRAFT_60981 [Volvox carteri f. nagariensis]|eukprot:XP_002951005.1 hypothetical protein VOLCADRAFT_60981 [Volvox carteri f. nagariensis]
MLVGVGSSVPETYLTNHDLEKLVETSDDWIVTRTGIKKRHVLGKGETLAQHGIASAKRALEMAGIAAQDVDLVLFATSSPDDVFGSACQVQASIGARHAVAFDLTAACSGFVVALVTAAQYIRAGTFRTVLVVGGDALSRFVDWRDRGTCILFGDGCGAVVVTANPDPEAPGAILGMEMGSDGGGHKHLHCTFAGSGMKPLSDGADPSSHAAYSNIYMAGQDVFKFAVRTVPAVIDGALAKANLPKASESVDWLVMHQANQRILDAAAQRLGLPAERVVSNLSQYGNTSAASIPLALDEAVRGGRIQKGDKASSEWGIGQGKVIAMAGFGAGLTWAGAIVRWG